MARITFSLEPFVSIDDERRLIHLIETRMEYYRNHPGTMLNEARTPAEYRMHIPIPTQGHFNHVPPSPLSQTVQTRTRREIEDIYTYAARAALQSPSRHGLTLEEAIRPSPLDSWRRSLGIETEQSRHPFASEIGQGLRDAAERNRESDRTQPEPDFNDRQLPHEE